MRRCSVSWHRGPERGFGRWRAAGCAAVPKALDDDHAAAATRAWRAMGCCGAGVQARVVARWRGVRRCGWGGGPFSCACYSGLAGGAGEQSVVADAMEPLGQNVKQEAPDELAGRECHRAKPLLAVAAVVLVAEGYAALVEADRRLFEIAVPGEIGEHRFEPGE